MLPLTRYVHGLRCILTICGLDSSSFNTAMLKMDGYASRFLSMRLKLCLESTSTKVLIQALAPSECPKDAGCLENLPFRQQLGHRERPQFQGLPQRQQRAPGLRPHRPFRTRRVQGVREVREARRGVCEDAGRW